ncbi:MULTISPECIES: hypothetical protein [Burkholderia cepacia complex]|jgi:hypothetical protein|uniref:hypothetical protein n=1 Tax=Burkholderia cepacia complex TaxID=87882 RepID=UPI001B9377C0|nr:hypothetical protein [Burkholderia ambifaria]MBR8221117.1 hypothetical protein [Burkholderia ambifaria]
MIRKAIGLVLVVCILTTLSGLIRGWGSRSSPAAAAPSQEEVRQQEEKRQRDEQSKKMQVITYGVIRDIYTNLRDPDSFKLHSVFIPDNDKVLVSCVEYFARNGFGGMNREYAVGTSTHGDFKFSPNNARIWNKMCADKRGQDFKTYGEFALERIKAASN